MRHTARFAMFLGLVGWPLVASAQQGGAPAPIVCAGTPQAAAAAQNPGRGGGRGPAPAPPTGIAPASPDVTTTEIPGVIKGGLKWTQIMWEAIGNNGDGIVSDKDGNVYFAQEVNSAALKIDKNDKVTVFAESPGIGSLAIDEKGRMFSVRRMLLPGNPAFAGPNPPPTGGVVQLTPEIKILADTAADGTKWVGGPSDLAVDKRGGAYFTQGCLYYASPDGKITLAAEMRTNGITFSPDYRVLYLTQNPGGPDEAPTMVAFDVQPDATLTNRRTFVTLRQDPADRANGDGSMVDAAGRLYVSIGSTIQVFDKGGKALGTIPTPGRVISIALGGPDHKTMYAVVNASIGLQGPIQGVQRTMRVFRIPAVAQGLKNRGK